MNLHEQETEPQKQAYPNSEPNTRTFKDKEIKWGVPITINQGDKFQTLIVEHEIDTPSGGPRKFLCRCEACGVTQASHIARLTRTKRLCRCQRRVSTHGGCADPEYSAWEGMIQRCHSCNPSRLSKDYYVDNGITVCDKWRHSYAAFLADVGRKPSLEYTLDRHPNPNGNYEPGNVRWATRTEQNLNLRKTQFVTVDGVRKPLCIACKDFGVSHDAVRRILRKYGIPPEMALAFCEWNRVENQPRTSRGTFNYWRYQIHEHRGSTRAESV